MANDASNTVSLFPLGTTPARRLERAPSPEAFVVQQDDAGHPMRIPFLDPKAADRPLQFPDTERVHAARRHAAATERARLLAVTNEALRIAEASAAAYANGKLEGDRHGYRRGWKGGVRWGIGCGVLGTLVLGSLAVIATLLWLGHHLPPVF